MGRKGQRTAAPQLPSSEDWAELCVPDPPERGTKRNRTNARARRKNPHTAARLIALVVSWIFGATADAARAATVQTLKYLMITAALTVLTGGSFLAFIQYDLFEILGRIATKTHVDQKRPDIVEKEMIEKQKPPSTPSDIETSGTKRASPEAAPAPKPSKPQPLPSDWKIEVFRKPSY